MLIIIDGESREAESVTIVYDNEEDEEKIHLTATSEGIVIDVIDTEGETVVASAWQDFNDLMELTQ